jgi:hypothetical protein
VSNLWDKILARQYTFFNTQVQKYIFSLQIGIMFLQQKFLEKRIDGAKLVDTVCKQAMMGAASQPSSESQKDISSRLLKALE